MLEQDQRNLWQDAYVTFGYLFMFYVQAASTNTKDGLCLPDISSAAWGAAYKKARQPIVSSSRLELVLHMLSKLLVDEHTLQCMHVLPHTKNREHTQLVCKISPTSMYMHCLAAMTISICVMHMVYAVYVLAGLYKYAHALHHSEHTPWSCWHTCTYMHHSFIIRVDLENVRMWYTYVYMHCLSHLLHKCTKQPQTNDREHITHKSNYSEHTPCK